MVLAPNKGSATSIIAADLVLYIVIHLRHEEMDKDALHFLCFLNVVAFKFLKMKKFLATNPTTNAKKSAIR